MSAESERESAAAGPASILGAQQETLSRMARDALQFKTCEACGRSFSTNLMTEIKKYVTCAECKPMVLQRLQEGVIRRLDHRQNYAQGSIRVGAFLFDGFLFYGPVNILVQFIVADVNPLTGRARDSYYDGQVAQETIALCIVVFLRVAYDTWMISKWGCTLGMALVKIRVILPGRDRIPAITAFYRSLWTFVAYFSLGVGFMIVDFDREKRSLADMMCGTRVVFKRR